MIDGLIGIARAGYYGHKAYKAWAQKNPEQHKNVMRKINSLVSGVSVQQEQMDSHSNTILQKYIEQTLNDSSLSNAEKTERISRYQNLIK